MTFEETTVVALNSQYAILWKLHNHLSASDETYSSHDLEADLKQHDDEYVNMLVGDQALRDIRLFFDEQKAHFALADLAPYHEIDRRIKWIDQFLVFRQEAYEEVRHLDGAYIYDVDAIDCHKGTKIYIAHQINTDDAVGGARVHTQLVSADTDFVDNLMQDDLSVRAGIIKEYYRIPVWATTVQSARAEQTRRHLAGEGIKLFSLEEAQTFVLFLEKMSRELGITDRILSIGELFDLPSETQCIDDPTLLYPGLRKQAQQYGDYRMINLSGLAIRKGLQGQGILVNSLIQNGLQGAQELSETTGQTANIILGWGMPGTMYGLTQFANNFGLRVFAAPYLPICYLPTGEKVIPFIMHLWDSDFDPFDGLSADVYARMEILFSAETFRTSLNDVRLTNKKILRGQLPALISIHNLDPDLVSPVLSQLQGDYCA